MIEKNKLLAGRYRLLEQIDSGGSAYIYKAIDEITKQVVAVKVLKPELTQNEEFVQRFKKEVQASLKLRHANIIRAYDAGLDGDLYYIVMDLIEGKTLKHLININGPLPVKYVISVAKKLCLALEYAHVKGFIHRDIKPHNVMIDMTGEPYIADFGIARNIAQSTITVEENSVMGSVHYFSPEQARGERADKRSDIYSLGILIYEMLTGKVPFDADTSVAIALKHINEEMPKVTDEMPDLPESLNKIVLKATQKDKHFRYKSAFNMYEDLQRCLTEPDGEYIKYTESKRTQQHLEETHMRRSKKSVKKMFITLGIGVGVVAAIILIVSLVLNQSVLGTLAVPQLSGMEQQNAIETLEEEGLLPNIVEEHSNQAVGTVIRQSPEAGKEIRAGSTVDVVVSKGLGTDVVPNVKDMSLEKAKEILKSAGLEASVREQPEGEYAIGTVIDQFPAAGDKVTENGNVVLTVKTSPDEFKIQVPKITGESMPNALRLLREAGFERFFVYEESSEEIPGTVLAQVPERRTEQLADQPVSLTISAFDYPQYIYSGSVDVTVPEDKTSVKIGMQDMVGDIPVFYIMTETVLEAGDHNINLAQVAVRINSEDEQVERSMVVFVNDTVLISQPVVFERAGS